MNGTEKFLRGSKDVLSGFFKGLWYVVVFVAGLGFAMAMIGLLSGCAHQDEWTRRDTTMQIGVTAIIVADAITTSRIQYHDNVFENGPWAKHALGLQPSTSDTYQYFVTATVFSYLVCRAIPAKWRPYWQTWEIAAHSYAVRNNCKNGLC